MHKNSNLPHPDYIEVSRLLEIHDNILDENCIIMNGNESRAWFKRLEAADYAVRSAFADATKDRNSRDNAMLINVGGPSYWHESDLCKLRQWLKKDGLYYGYTEKMKRK